MQNVKHGAKSQAVVRRTAGYVKQSVLQPLGLRQGALSLVGVRHLDIYSRNMAKVQLMDRWVAEHGWLDEKGNPPPFAAVYFTALNAASRALVKLEPHLLPHLPVEADYFDQYREG
jgi:hypothetical protein